MTLHQASVLFAAALALTACQKVTVADNAANNTAEPTNATGANTAEAHPSDPIESAMAAAPASVAGNATIAQAAADGTMQVLREGSNGWTCMPDNPATPGPDPMCGDANAMEWAHAWMTKGTPAAEKPGFMYMLAGGTDASNTDPYAKAPTEGNNWVETGPHVMVVGSSAILTGYPSGGKPDTKAPYVMWAGTPYAHLMIPVGD
jgi:hypothetical protein